MVVGPDKFVKRFDERVKAGAVGPHKPVAMNLALGVARKLTSVANVGRVKYPADVGVVFHAVAVILCPAAHVRIVRAGIFYQAGYSGGSGRQEVVEGDDEGQHLDNLHGQVLSTGRERADMEHNRKLVKSTSNRDG